MIASLFSVESDFLNSFNRLKNYQESESYDSINDDIEFNNKPKKSNYILDTSLNILFKVFQSYPEFIDENFVTSMISLINQSPIESAQLLRIYSSSFDSIENPWPLLDMLITYKKIFTKDSSGSTVIIRIYDEISDEA